MDLHSGETVSFWQLNALKFTPLPSACPLSSPLNHFIPPSLPVLEKTTHPPPVTIISSPGRMRSYQQLLCSQSCSQSCASIVLSIHEALGPVSMTTKGKLRTKKRDREKTAWGNRSCCCGCCVHGYNGNAMCFPWHCHLLALKFFFFKFIY